MLKTLLKKEYQECFRTYFVKAKTGKKRSKMGIIGMFALFAFLMIFLLGVFFGLSYLIGEPLFEMELAWCFYTIMGIIAIFLGAFGSIFNTYAALYLAKDNELLLSMPIPPSQILLSRISLVYGLSLLYSGVVWLPAAVYSSIFTELALSVKILQFVLFPFIALFVTVVTCVLGWVVALISTKIKNQSFLVVIITLLFLGGYYYVCFNMSGLLDAILDNIGKLESVIKQYGGIFYLLGAAAAGDTRSLLIFCGLSVVLNAICFWILSRTFTRFVLKASNSGRSHAKAKYGNAHGVSTALFYKEMKRFTSSATYMLNCGIGLIMLVALGVMALIKKDLLLEIISGLLFFLPKASDFLPVIIALIVSAVSGMNMISTPSISLEGKNLWLLQVLPVSGADVMRAKLKLHMLLNLVPALFASAAMCYSLKQTFLNSVLAVLFIVLFVWLNGVFGLIIGVLRPNFTWTSETTPIKQSLNVLLSMLFALLVLLLCCGSYYFTWKYCNVRVHMGICCGALGIASIIADRWLMTKGAKKIASL